MREITIKATSCADCKLLYYDMDAVCFTCNFTDIMLDENVLLKTFNELCPMEEV